MNPSGTALRNSARGLTIVELVVMAVVVAILATGAFLIYRPVSAKVPYQAEGLRNNLRHMQFLATAWGAPLRLTYGGGSYSVGCPKIVALTPCSATGTITDPATNQSFSVTLETGITFSASSTLDMDALGRPATSCDTTCALKTTSTGLTLSGDGTSWTLSVAALTGFISLATP